MSGKDCSSDLTRKVLYVAEYGVETLFGRAPKGKVSLIFGLKSGAACTKRRK